MKSEQRRRELRQMQHDLRSCLGVLTTGLQVLESCRDQPEEFAEMQKMMLEAGLQPLEKGLNDLVALAIMEDENTFAD